MGRTWRAFVGHRRRHACYEDENQQWRHHKVAHFFALCYYAPSTHSRIPPHLCRCITRAHLPVGACSATKVQRSRPAPDYLIACAIHII
ncbi:MAG: hypothetical protein FVQ76_06805 [Nitrospira sp.]|nr:hypothetical protein [Nitrospira sp.]